MAYCDELATLVLARSYSSKTSGTYVQSMAPPFGTVYLRHCVLLTIISTVPPAFKDTSVQPCF